MKDTAVDPAGLFDLRRQRRLLDGLINRFSGSLSKQQMLLSAHAQQQSVEEAQMSAERAKVAYECRIRRRTMLELWERTEEKAVRQYESKTIRLRNDLNRLGALFRQKAQEEKQILERKVAARHQAIQQQYENRKNQPGQQQRKEFKLIADALEPIQGHLQQAREIALRRLNEVPEVGPTQDGEDDFHQPAPETIEQAIESIRLLSKKCHDAVVDLKTTSASKVVDPPILPIAVIVIVLFMWAAASYFVADASPVWIAAGIVPAGLAGLGTYLALILPLRSTTRRLFPIVQRIANAANECAAAGKKISTQIATEAADELIQRRDEHLSSTQRWLNEQLELMHQRLETEQKSERLKLNQMLESTERDYIESFAAVDQEMRMKADAVANQISSQLAAIDTTLQQRRSASAASRSKQMERLTHRLGKGVRDGIGRMDQATEMVEKRFPDWFDVVSQPFGESRGIDFLPLGWLPMDQTLRSTLQLHQQTSNDSVNHSAAEPELPELVHESNLPSRLPVVLHRRLTSAVVIRCAPAHLEAAVDLVHQTLWRLLTAAPPARAKLTLIDSLGRGQNFTGFMALADHDPAIVGHRVWTTDNTIDVRLAELADHAEDVLQSSLRDRFERIEDYNEVAGSMAQPYRVIAAVGFPEGLSRIGYGHLCALIESGLRCGVLTLLVCDRTKAWPTDMPIPSGDKVIELEISDSGQWRLLASGFQDMPFEPAKAPAKSIREELVHQIGSATVAASKVEIPLHSLLSATTGGSGSSDDGLRIVIGSQGANRTLSLQLGEGVRQHVLIAGKTGSGKSTLLHSIITSAAFQYRPDQLQFYLLDFKKGVEFQPYAASGLPHARVIGIESEREFGRSVLQRLDAELQYRGEQFRASGCQDLAEHRRVSGQTMPRIMLVIDEFQELFVRDDRLAGDCAMLLDRLVRQGRSFGMHVVLSSQSLAGAYSLPRATLGQMAVRIAMQCSESDASLILSDDNTGARLISRPGEAIYNDAGGLIEGNQPFQVAWLSADRHDQLLHEITARDQPGCKQLEPTVVFEGNRPCWWSPELALRALHADASTGQTTAGLQGLLGESVEIGPPLTLTLGRDTGRNVLLIASVSARRSVVGSLVTGFAKNQPGLQVVYFDGSRSEDQESLAPWLCQAGVSIRTVIPRDSASELNQLAQTVSERGNDDSHGEPIVVIVDPLERFRDLRQDESFNFSLDSAVHSPTGSTALQTLLREGPAAGVFVILISGSADTLSRWLPRASQHDLALRILGPMNSSDSSLLIDSPVATDLSAATLLLYDDADGRITKFRRCDLPESSVVKHWLG